jgi:hypothetical protein
VGEDEYRAQLKVLVDRAYERELSAGDRDRLREAVKAARGAGRRDVPTLIGTRTEDLGERIRRMTDLEEIRSHLTPEKEDESGYLTPSQPSQLAALTDEELFRLYRKLAFANLHPHSAMIEHESRARLIRAMTAFHTSSEKASRKIAALTWALIALSVVIAISRWRSSSAGRKFGRNSARAAS